MPPVDEPFRWPDERRRDWNLNLLGVARAVALKSKDPSTKTGAVLTDWEYGTLATGFNGFPRGVGDSPLRYADREMKYKLTVHAEANAILQAAKRGISLDGAKIFTTFFPCNECAKMIIQAGIEEVVCPVIPDDALGDRWKESFEFSKLMFTEAGVKVRFVEEENENNN